MKGKRSRLWHDDPRCFWCGRLTDLHTANAHKTASATLDHIYPRHHPKRNASNCDEVVLACHQCNYDRNHSDNTGHIFIPKLLQHFEKALAGSMIAAHHGKIRTLDDAIRYNAVSDYTLTNMLELDRVNSRTFYLTWQKTDWLSARMQNEE